MIFRTKRKAIITFGNYSHIVEVKESQSGFIALFSSNKIMILGPKGVVVNHGMYAWAPHSGFTQEELKKYGFKKN